MVLPEQDVELLPQGEVLLREQVGQEEVGVDDAAAFGYLPVHGDGGADGVAPAGIDGREVGLVDGQLREAGLVEDEVFADKEAQLLVVRVEAEAERTLLECVADGVHEEPELARFMVRGLDVPVEIVLVEDVADVVVGHEGDLLRIEGAEEGGRHVLIEGARPADGQDQLHERLVDVVRGALLGFGPEQVDPFGGCFRALLQGQRGDGHGKVDLAQDGLGLVVAEIIAADPVLDFFFGERVEILHKGAVVFPGAKVAGERVI